MPVLLVRTADGLQRLSVAAGQSIREALDTTAWRVRAACGGSGTCGACLITLISGEVTPPTVAEYMKLMPEERAAGSRLACQLRLLGTTEIRLEQPAPPSPWKSIPGENLIVCGIPRPELTAHPYGVAVDLGTTHIRVSLWDRQRGQRIATRHGPNPQAGFGADVLNRLSSAQTNQQRAREIAELAREAILHALRDILARDIGEVSPMLAKIGELFIVGNTAMLALLTGSGAAMLANPDNWQGRIDIQPLDHDNWQAAWHMPHARIVLPPIMAGFVGSDLAADLVAAGLVDGPAASLLLDFGTNTEIALWDGQRLHVTSVPGGPAFEGAGIRHGMSADTGAICSVTALGGAFSVTTIGDCEALGFCGSGLTDAVALLLAGGHLKQSGRFASPPGPEGFRLLADNPHTAIHGQDIDAFQRAKAATAAAMAMLLRRAGMQWQDLQRLCVCGAFGRTLNTSHAQAVGLLPAIAPERIELHAEASLAGCEMGLLASNGELRFQRQVEVAELINLAALCDYDVSYIDHLRLRPICGLP